MEPTYVYANIRLPILVNSDENLEPLSEYLTIDFESCDELPEKPEKGIDYSVIIEKLRELLNMSTMNEEELAEFCLPEPKPSDKEVINHVETIPIVNKKLFVTREEIKQNKKKIKQNYTSKQRPRKVKNFTMRTREEIQENIENTISNALGKAFGSSRPQEAQEQGSEDDQ